MSSTAWKFFWLFVLAGAGIPGAALLFAAYTCYKIGQFITTAHEG